MNQAETHSLFSPISGFYPHELYIKHASILGIGAVLGLLVAYFVGGIPFDFSEEIERARELGIVSQTIINDYPASLDVLNYVIVLGFPVLCALMPWFIWSRGCKHELQDSFDRSGVSPTGLGQRQSLLFLLVIAIVFIVTLNIHNFYRPAFNPHIGAWLFLGEEGEMLDWAYRIINGEVYGRDYFCLYGPMLLYPLSWALELFGMSVAVERIYTYSLNMIGYGVVIYFLYKTLWSRRAFVITSIVYLCAFNMTLYFSPNTTVLRFALGILPLLLFHMYRSSMRPITLVFAGVVAGQSLLFSQEAGLCSIITVGFLLLVDFFTKRDLRRVVREGGIFLGSIVFSVAPFLVFFVLNGAMGSFFESIYGYPRLLTLGYGNLPFPPFRDFVARPLTGGMYFYYWVIFVYIISLLDLLPRVFLRRVDQDTQLKLALTVFGLLLFRIALGRSDESNVMKASLPAFLLCFIFIDRALYSIKLKKRNSIRLGGCISIAACVLSISLLFLYSPRMKNQFLSTYYEVLHPLSKFSDEPSGYSVPGVKRADVFVDASTAKTIMDLNEFLSANTQPKDFVYFFPNEAVYYFLFDRRNPTRYPISYFAISREQRLELVKDLEEKKPRYVMFSTNTWRIDNIPEDIQVPEVVTYIQEKYRFIRQFHGVRVLERIEL